MPTVEANEPRALLDRLVQLRIVDPGLARQDQRDGQRQPRGVHHPVAAEASVGPREAVAPRTDHALPVRRFQRQTPQARHDRVVAGRHHVLGEQHDDVAVVPGLEAVGREVRRPLGLLAHEREVFGIAAGEQGEGIQGTRDRVLPVGGVRDPFRQRLAPLLENALRLRAVVGRGGAVGAEDGQFQDDILGLAGPPADQRQVSATRLRFGRGERLAQLGARVVGERLAADAEDHVADREDPVGGGILLHLGDRDLPRVRGYELVTEHPPAGPGGPQVPVVVRPGWDLVALGEVRAWPSWAEAPATGDGAARNENSAAAATDVTNICLTIITTS